MAVNGNCHTPAPPVAIATVIRGQLWRATEAASKVLAYCQYGWQNGSLRGSFNKEGLVGTLSGHMSGSGVGSGTINLPAAGCKLSFTLAKK